MDLVSDAINLFLMVVMESWYIWIPMFVASFLFLAYFEKRKRERLELEGRWKSKKKGKIRRNKRRG